MEEKNSRSELIWMLKHGRAGEALERMHLDRHEAYPGGFVQFMDRMLEEHHLTRKEVAVRAGMSQDYTYKLLRGDKHTDNRDYILAICVAAGLTLAQTQHALSIYGMPLLSEADLRSHIIMLAIAAHDSVDALNDMLEHAGFPLLRTSPDMPTAPITSSQPVAETEHREAWTPETFEELETWVDGQPNGGDAPFDYDFQGWMRVEDARGRTYVVEALYSEVLERFRVYTGEQWTHLAERIRRRLERDAEFASCVEPFPEEAAEQQVWLHAPDIHEAFLQYLPDAGRDLFLESYETVEAAAASRFFPAFLSLDRETDRKVAEVMKQVDDTRFSDWRIGVHRSGNMDHIHMEAFNTSAPENQEYFQMVLNHDGTYVFTGTHESCYMRMELGEELYALYFGRHPAPEPFVHADMQDRDRLGFRDDMMLSHMLSYMYDYNASLGGMYTLDAKTVRDEKIHDLFQTARLQQQNGQNAEAEKSLVRAMHLMEEDGEVADAELNMYMRAMERLCWVSGDAGAWYARIYGMRERVLAFAEREGDESAGEALTDLALATLYMARREGEHLQHPWENRYLEEGMQLIEEHHAAADNWQALFEFHSSSAFALDSVDVERAVRYYRKALTIARNHHLDQEKPTAYAVAVTHYNLGWVLWNVCGNTEAVICYGHALDLLETYLFNGIVPRDRCLEMLKKTGEKLEEIYRDTGKKREAAELKTRLAQNGVDL